MTGVFSARGIRSLREWLDQSALIASVAHGELIQ